MGFLRVYDTIRGTLFHEVCSPFSFKRGSLTAFGFVVVVHGVDEHKIILVERVSTNRKKTATYSYDQDS